LADEVFSTARLRGYRVLEEAGLGDAVGLQVLNAVIAGRLWLPFSLIEIAFRNVADRAIAGAHERGDDWLIAAGREGDVLVAIDVIAPAALQAFRPDGSQEDPVADAAQMAGRQLNRERISRDDLIAHLMLGFWVRRCPAALHAECGLQVWDLVAASLDSPLDQGERLESVMTQLARTRNRVAHHEPLLFRAKHVFTKAGEPKTGAALVSSLQDAIPPFLEEVQLAVDTAKTIAPMAADYLDPVPDLIRTEIAPLEATLREARRRLREAREARMTAREAERDAKLGTE
jgi:hypothetical protein